MKKSFIIFIIVSVFLGSCINRNREITVDMPTGIDSVYYARGFNISYFDNYISVDIRDPWDTLKMRQKYILVDKDSILPANLPEGVIIRIPVERAVIYTSVHTALAEQMGVLDKVVGVCEPEYIISKSVLDKIEEGKIEDLGSSTSPNIERIMDIKSEIIIASPFENSGYGVAEKLGIPIVEAADYMESHPLGRAEWIRFYGLLFGERGKADSMFFAVVQNYNRLKQLTAEVGKRPTVMLERKYGASWFVPSGDSYIGTIHADAGADYIFSNYRDSGNTPLSFETVLDKGVHADYWLFKYDTKRDMTYSDLADEYPPYRNFDPFKNKKIYICNTILTPYYDDITLHPDWILEDLIYIYHPNLLPGHQMKYYQKMK